MKLTLSALFATLTLLPAAAMAAPINVSPAALTLEIGGRVFAKVAASAASPNLKVTSTCYATAGSPRDILKVTGINTQSGAKESKFSMDIRAQRAGKCTITFTSDANTATVHVTVEEEKP